MSCEVCREESDETVDVGVRFCAATAPTICAGMTSATRASAALMLPGDKMGQQEINTDDLVNECIGRLRPDDWAYGAIVSLCEELDRLRTDKVTVHTLRHLEMDEVTVHILRHLEIDDETGKVNGATLCGFCEGVPPAQWPDGHLYVGAHDPDLGEPNAVEIEENSNSNVACCVECFTRQENESSWDAAGR